MRRHAVISEKSIRDKADFELILTAYRFKNRHKGARQIKMTLEKYFDTIMNLKKIRRLMAKFNLVCPIRKANPYRRMAKKMATTTRHTNHLNRQFQTDKPGNVFLTDITYLKYQNKQAYLSTIKDSCTKEIVAYQLSDNLRIDFVLKTLNHLESNTIIQENALIHSDQGCHYTSTAFQQAAKSLNLKQSMSRRGNCWDNAPQESFYGHMKDELHLEKCQSYKEVEAEVNNYMEYYNHFRCQWGLNRMSPSQYHRYLTA